MKKILAIILISFVSLSALANETLIFRAMQDELERSMNELKFDSFGKPYYISYRVVDSHRFKINASLGAILSKEENKRRELVVDLRVGDYDVDSSNLFELNFRRVSSLLAFDARVSIPMDADYTEIRRRLWLATDSAYKKAVQRLAKKEAILANKKSASRADDFLKVESSNHVEKIENESLDLDKHIQLMKRLSAIGKKYPSIDLSELDWMYVSAYTRIIDSEGRKVGRNDRVNRIVFRAEAQASDGEPIFEEDFVFAETPSDLPSRKKLSRFIKERYDSLSERQKANKMESYVGPVLFKPKAAAELLRQTIASKAAAYRQPEKDPSTSIRGFGTNTLQGQLKQRILPRGYSIIDDPTLTEYEGEALLGAFSYDDQGVKANKKQIIKNGRLVDLYSQRSPIQEIQVNGGNHNDGFIAASNLVFESKRPFSQKELIDEMLILSEELEMDYGIVIEKLDGHFSRLTRPSHMIFFGGDKGLTLHGLSAYKLYKDGRKEPIRQLQLPNFDIRSLKDIVAAGTDMEVYHSPSAEIGRQFFGNSGDTRKYNISSFVVPSILFEELSLSPQEENNRSFPVRKQESFGLE